MFPFAVRIHIHVEMAEYQNIICHQPLWFGWIKITSTARIFSVRRMLNIDQWLLIRPITKKLVSAKSILNSTYQDWSINYQKVSPYDHKSFTYLYYKYRYNGFYHATSPISHWFSAYLPILSGLHSVPRHKLRCQFAVSSLEPPQFLLLSF